MAKNREKPTKPEPVEPPPAATTSTGPAAVVVSGVEHAIATCGSCPWADDGWCTSPHGQIAVLPNTPPPPACPLRSAPMTLRVVD